MVLLSRFYLDVIGRIPTSDEVTRCLSRDPSNRLNALIDELLDSQCHQSHLFNYFADMRRIKYLSGKYSSTHSYQIWVKKQLRQNRPWDEMVTKS